MRGYTNLYVKRRLVQLETDILGIISQGLAEKRPKRAILLDMKKQILSVCRDLKFDSTETNNIWFTSLNRYNKLVKETFPDMRIAVHKGQFDDQKNEIIYKKMRNSVLKNEIIKISNEFTYDYEQRMKRENIFGVDGLLSNAFSPFFLASSHPKPAKDHEDWEGKCYYDEDWEEKGDYSEDVAYKIRAYIRNHKLNTIQFVTGPGIWLGLRKNCKHFFKSIPVDEVLSSSVKKMLKKHGMIHEETKPASYEVLQYREYYNRLKTLLELEKKIPNKLLEEDISRTRKVLNKWKKALK